MPAVHALASVEISAEVKVHMTHEAELVTPLTNNPIPTKTIE